MSSQIHPGNEKGEPGLQTASDICIPEEASSIYDLGGHVKVIINYIRRKINNKKKNSQNSNFLASSLD